MEAAKGYYLFALTGKIAFFIQYIPWIMQADLDQPS